jgi:hypothetical protein
MREGGTRFSQSPPRQALPKIERTAYHPGPQGCPLCVITGTSVPVMQDYRAAKALAGPTPSQSRDAAGVPVQADSSGGGGGGPARAARAPRAGARAGGRPGPRGRSWSSWRPSLGRGRGSSRSGRRRCSAGRAGSPTRRSAPSRRACDTGQLGADAVAVTVKTFLVESAKLARSTPLGAGGHSGRHVTRFPMKWHGREGCQFEAGVGINVAWHRTDVRPVYVGERSLFTVQLPAWLKG